MQREFGIPKKWPVPIRIDGHTLHFETRATRELVTYVATDQWAQIIPYSLDEESREYVTNRVGDLSDSLDWVHLIKITHQVIESISGTTWHATQVICAFMAGQWLQFDSWCVEKGFDTDTASFSRLVSAGYAMLRDAYVSIAQKDKKNIEMELMKLQNILWPPDTKNAAKEEHKIMDSFLAGAKVNPDGSLS